MNKDVERIIEGGNYNCPLFKKQDSTTWATLQDKICFDCACKIHDNYMVFQDVMAVDENFKTSCKVDRLKIKDWISVFWPNRHFSSVYGENIKCSECGKKIEGKVWFDHNNPNWGG